MNTSAFAELKIALTSHTADNTSLITARLPTDWKMAKVAPLYKAGDRINMNNYRPISLL